MKDQFSVSPGLLYFSAANQSLCPNSVLAAQEAYRREYEKNPTQAMSAAWEGLWRAQQRLASFLGTDPKNLFLRQNATAVLNTLILGVPLKREDEILVGEFEYGAVVNICRLKVAREGVALRTLHLPRTKLALARLTPESLTDLIVSQLGPRTKMLVLSHVMGATGLRVPIEAIAEQTRKRDVFFICDGTHGLGAFPVDFSLLKDVDAYGAGLYKWVLGPKGTAFGWVAPRHHDRLEPTQGGWTTFESFEPLKAFGGGSRFQERFLMHGCLDFAPFLALHDLVGFWEGNCPERIFAHRRELFEKLRVLVEGVPSLSVLNPPGASSGPMLVVLLPAEVSSLERLSVTLLREFGLSVTFSRMNGKACLILSPHIYNTIDDCANAIKAVRAVCG